MYRILYNLTNAILISCGPSTVTSLLQLACPSASCERSSQFRAPPRASSPEQSVACDHITPLLRQLHWLPIRQRVTFKLACLVYLSLSGNTPMYLADDIHLLSESDRRQLRSSSARTCIVPRTHNSYGDRSFAATGPRLWNSLPSHLRYSDIGYNDFKRQLKTFLFR